VILLYEQRGNEAVIIGDRVERGHSLLQCEGCDGLVPERFETDDMVMLCKKCFDLCKDDA
jgi:hypothetical protein